MSPHFGIAHARTNALANRFIPNPKDATRWLDAKWAMTVCLETVRTIPYAARFADGLETFATTAIARIENHTIGFGQRCRADKFTVHGDNSAPFVT